MWENSYHVFQSVVHNPSDPAVWNAHNPIQIETVIIVYYDARAAFSPQSMIQNTHAHTHTHIIFRWSAQSTTKAGSQLGN